MCNSPTASKFLLHILKIFQKIQLCSAPSEIAVALPSTGGPTPAPPRVWKPLRRRFWLGPVSYTFHIQGKVYTKVSHCILLLEEKKTNNKANNQQFLSAGTNGAQVSCGFASCMIDFCRLRMSTSISSQLGHFVGFPLCRISWGKARTVVLVGAMVSSSLSHSHPAPTFGLQQSGLPNFTFCSKALPL